MGVGNFIAGTVSGSSNGETTIDALGCRVASQTDKEWRIGAPVMAAIRAEKITLSATQPAEGSNVIEGRLGSAVYQGATSSFKITIDTVPDGLTVRSSNETYAGMATLQLGQTVWLTWPAESVRLLPKD
jgi:ABC-type Fe3+/spermidine/putrescine transport system ATPase subunit